MQTSTNKAENKCVDKVLIELASYSSLKNVRSQMRFLELTLEKEEDLGYDKNYECEFDFALM